MRFRTLPMFLAFFLVGLADAMGPMSDGVKKQYALSGLMCMAISGGALVPLLMGWLVDMDWKTTAYVVPFTCFVYLLLLSFNGGRKRQKAA
jgi:fucose permease